MDGSFLEILSMVIAFIIGITIHEFSHALAAYLQGDPTAKFAGRLTLNPLAHIDILGTVIMPLLLLFLGAPVVGWAKPVPFNPYNLRNPKYGPFLVAFAGPFSNFITAGVFAILLLVLSTIAPASSLALLLKTIISINIILMIFNLIPIPPLDGSTVLFSLLPQRYEKIEIFLRQYGFWILILLLVTGVLYYILIIGRLLILELFGITHLF